VAELVGGERRHARGDMFGQHLAPGRVRWA
jgi:hypothetical protein